jgi:hypothetical protein
MLELFTQNEFDLNFVFWGFCLSGLFSAGGMGLWHGVEFYENEKLVGEREFLRPKVKTFEMFFFCFSPLRVPVFSALSRLGRCPSHSRHKVGIMYSNMVAV